jgi:RecA-family ATPase
MNVDAPKPYIVKQYRSQAERETPQAPVEEQRVSRFRLLRFKELKPGTTSNYLIKDILPRVGLVAIWGPPKCGKSFWMFDVSMHIALGWQYRNRRTLQGPVAYCACEGASGFHARAAAFRIEHNIPDGESVPFFLMPTRLDLVRDHQALITSIAAQLSSDEAPILVVLDTLNRSLNGSESKDEDMSAYINAADAIRERFGCLADLISAAKDELRACGRPSILVAYDVIAGRAPRGSRGTQEAFGEAPTGE